MLDVKSVEFCYEAIKTSLESDTDPSSTPAAPPGIFEKYREKRGTV